MPTQGPARGSDERLREEQIDADERLREEQTRPMSGLLRAVPNDVCPRVGQDADGVGMVMAAGAGIEVLGPGVSATGVGGPVQAGRTDRRTEVGEQARRAGEDAVEVPAQGDGGGRFGDQRSQSDAVGAQDVGQDEDVEPIIVVAGRIVSATHVRQLIGAGHHEGVTGGQQDVHHGAVGTFDGDFPDSGVGQAAQQPPQSRCAVFAGAAQHFRSVRGDDRDCATPNFGAGMWPPVCSLLGVRWRSALSPASTPGDRRVPRNSSRTSTPSSGAWRQDHRHEDGAAMSGCAKSRNDR